MPPVGDLRFKPPEPAPPWGDRLEAFEFGAECMQGDKFSTGDRWIWFLVQACHVSRVANMFSIALL